MTPKATSLTLLAMILAGSGMQLRAASLKMDELTAKKILSVIVPADYQSELKEILGKANAPLNDDRAAKLIENTSKKMKRSVCSQFP